MRHLAAAVSLTVLLAACGGQSSEEQLQNAASQSDPAAAEVLNGAAENGMNPQEALEQAGQAQAQAGNSAQPNSTVQARPNLPQSPNRPDGTRPPDKVDVQAGAAAPADDHSGHNSH